MCPRLNLLYEHGALQKAKVRSAASWIKPFETAQGQAGHLHELGRLITSAHVKCQHSLHCIGWMRAFMPILNAEGQALLHSCIPALEDCLIEAHASQKLAM